MPIDFLDSVKHAAIEAVASMHANCRCLIYSTGLPTTRTALPTSGRLAAIPTPATTHNLPVDRVANLAAVWTALGSVNGVAASFYIVSGADGAEVIRARGTVSGLTGTGDMKLNDVNIVQGVEIRVESYPLTIS